MTFLLLELILCTFSIISISRIHSLPTFNYDVSCLIQTAALRENSSLQSADFSEIYELHLDSSHRLGILSRHLISPFRNISTQFWRSNCMEILIFDNSGNYREYWDEIIYWGRKSRVTIFLILSVKAVQLLARSTLYEVMKTLNAPIYVIVPVEGEIQTSLVSPTSGTLQFKRLPAQNSGTLPSARELNLLRRVFDLNQNWHKLAFDPIWLRNLVKVDCEIHRDFTRTGSPCFSAFGPMLVMARKLNFTYADKG